MHDAKQFVATYDSLKTIIYDTETGKVAMQLVNDDSTTDSSYRINRILSHPSQPILITAHDDRKIRYFDKNSGRNSETNAERRYSLWTSVLGRMIHSMVAHLNTVTSLAMDPQQTCLVSGSKNDQREVSLRLTWVSFRS